MYIHQYLEGPVQQMQGNYYPSAIYPQQPGPGVYGQPQGSGPHYAVCH